MSASTQVQPDVTPTNDPPRDVLEWVRSQLAWERWLAAARDRRQWEATRAELEDSQPSSTAAATSSSK